VPGSLFGLPEGVSTTLLEAWSFEGVPAAVRWIRQREPSAQFLTWPRRAEVEAFALEELPQRYLSEPIDDLAG
jgi:hypothetical protein